jgi:hypothetical protein
MRRASLVPGLSLVMLCVAPSGCVQPRGTIVLEARDPGLAAVAFLAGSWTTNEGEVRTEEHWTAPAGGTMIGVNRVVRGDRTLFHEFLQLVRDGDKIEYLAAPKGRYPPTVFRLIEAGEGRATFENPAHDFPRRITYWKDADGHLNADIEGTERGQERTERWRMHPAVVRRGE